MLARIVRLAAIALALAAARPAAAEELQKFTIAFAGKGMSFHDPVHRDRRRLL